MENEKVFRSPESSPISGTSKYLEQLHIQTRSHSTSSPRLHQSGIPRSPSKSNHRNVSQERKRSSTRIYNGKQFRTTGNNSEHKRGGDDASRNRSEASMYEHSVYDDLCCDPSPQIAAEIKFDPSINSSCVSPMSETEFKYNF